VIDEASLAPADERLSWCISVGAFRLEYNRSDGSLGKADRYNFRAMFGSLLSEKPTPA